MSFFYISSILLPMVVMAGALAAFLDNEDKGRCLEVVNQ